MYCCRLVRMAILVGWIWFLIVILIGISPVIIRYDEHIALRQFGIFFLTGVRKTELVPLASWKSAVVAIYFCSIHCRAFPEGERVCALSRFSRVPLFVTLWTIVHQTPLSTGFSRREYRSGVTISVLYCAHLCMKYSLGITNFLEEISSLSHSIVLLDFFALISEVLWSNSCEWIKTKEKKRRSEFDL